MDGGIKALERQKEYSDIIHDEREALRDEVCRLRDALKVEMLKEYWQSQPRYSHYIIIII